ncbi:DUF5686 and carboxypeptidase regulatory-like domain-containing protein [Flavitalea flava]
MARILTLCLIGIFSFITSRATIITGTVRDDKGSILAYASILVKGTTKGVTANKEGKYFLDLPAGDYTLVCQYVGYTREEKKIALEAGTGDKMIDFHLSLQQLSMAEIIVRPGGEDPAYEIIRNAIKKRKDYQSPLDSFTCEAYIKTQIKTRKLPRKVLGQKIEEKDKLEMGVDSAGKGIIFLSESLTKVSFKKPGKIKLEVLSGRESGSNGYGFSLPTFINFYDNNITVLGEQLSPRGFISPIAETALNFYRYKYLGSFFEDGKEINKIQVIPRRKYEPLFSGTINIMEGEWRIHSLDLLLLKQAQLEILDTLQIRQIHVPVGNGVWQTKDQVVYFTFNILGIDAVGNFLNVYNKYEAVPKFRKKYFNNIVMKFDTAANKKSKAYWDSIRPVQLEPEELTNYRVKDSIFHNNRDSMHSRRNRDSLLKRQGPVKIQQILSGGFSRSDYGPVHPVRYSMEGLIPNLLYNTVEGLNLSFNGSVSTPLKRKGQQISFSPHIRYGFHNIRLNAWAAVTLDKKPFATPGMIEMDGDQISQHWTLSGGKRVSQFNAGDPARPGQGSGPIPQIVQVPGPITESINALYTLFLRRNYMKIYENVFGELSWSGRLDNGLRIRANALYEDRIPIENTTDFSIFHVKNREFTPNYPVEQIGSQFPRHQVLLTGLYLQYQPGQQYIEYPRRKIAIGSKYPTLALAYQKGWNGVLGSDVNFDKWQFSIWDEHNFKLKGMLKYRFGIGGFLNSRSVFIQDYQHFNGNQTFIASEYLNSFQLAPYYANSTTSAFYSTGHIEHHFNGFLTNKIPLFRRLNWHLVGAVNAFYVNRDNNYVEVSGGLENLFKVLRVDLVTSYLNGHNGQFGVRIGLGGLLGGNVKAGGN